MQALVSEAGLALERSRAARSRSQSPRAGAADRARSRASFGRAATSPSCSVAVSRRRRRGRTSSPLLRPPRRAARADAGRWPNGSRRCATARRCQPAAGRKPRRREPPHGGRRRRLETPALDDGTPRRRPRALRARRSCRPGDADRRAGAGARRARVPPSAAGDWSPNEIALAEAVAREAAVAIDTSRLLRENDRRLAEQQALLKAGRGADERPPLRHRDRPPRRRASLARQRRRCRLLDARSPAATSSSAAQCSGCPRTEIGRTVPVAGTIGDAIAPASLCCGATSARPSSHHLPTATRASPR